MKPRDVLARLFADLLQEMLGQQRNVGDALAQRRQFDVDHVDAVVEILAESPVGHHPAEVVVRGQDHARIDVERLRAADLLELEVLQHAKQFDLHGRAGRADFVEEDRPFVGQLELADLFAHRAGERAGHVAEQFAFQQRLGQRAAGDFDERLDRAAPLWRWIARAISDLPVPLSPVISTVALRVGHGVDHVEDLQHAVVVPDDVLHAEAQIELGLQGLVLLDDLLLVRAPAGWPPAVLRRSAAW